MFAEERCFPPRVFVAKNVLPTNVWTDRQTVGFDAICLFSGTRLQGYTFNSLDDQPTHWRRVNEMEALAFASMTRAEFDKRLPFVERGWNPEMSPRAQKDAHTR